MTGPPPRDRGATRPVLFFLAGPLVAAASSCADGPPPQNLVLLSVDSLRADHVSALGRTNDLRPDDRTTPAFDRLAAGGALFENAFSSSSWTLPAHASLMTGLPDELHGVHDNFQRLAPELDTMAELFSQRGYRTAGFFSGPNVHPVYGFGQGFDSYVDLSHVEVDPARLENHQPGDLRDVHLASHQAITSPALLRHASAFLEEAAIDAAPFFLFVHWWDPHYDYLAPLEYVERFVDPSYAGPVRGLHSAERVLRMQPEDLRHLRRLYDAEIRYTDDHIGELLDHLDAAGLTDSTLVVWTADHGEEFHEHGRWGHQRTLFDDVVRVPLALAGPGVPEGVRVEGIARLYDVLPTVAELLDLPLPGYVLGLSLAPLWRDPEHAGYPAVLRLAVPRQGYPVDLAAVRFGHLKVLEDRTNQRTVLYDLERDPGEQHPIPAAQLGIDHRGALARALAELEALERHKERLPGRAQSAELPEELSRQLGAAGYLGADDDGAGAGEN